MGLRFSRKAESKTVAAGGNNENMATTNGNVIAIHTRQEWDAKVFEANTNGKIIVVDFWASWCGPCRVISPFFVELAGKYPQLVFLKVDVDELNDLSHEWGVQAMPTFVFIKEGKQIDKLAGVKKSELEKKVLGFANSGIQK